MPRSGAAMRATESGTQDSLYRQPVRARGDTSLTNDQHRKSMRHKLASNCQGHPLLRRVHRHSPEKTTGFEWITNEGVQMKILVRNLSRETNENEVREMFQVYGAVQYCKLVMDQETDKTKEKSNIEMPRPGDAKAAIKELNGRELGGNKIRVKKAEQSEEKGNE